MKYLKIKKNLFFKYLIIYHIKPWLYKKIGYFLQFYIINKNY